MPVRSVEIFANPVTKWEQFGMTLDRSEISAPRVEHRDIGGYYSFKFDIISDQVDRSFASDFLTNGVMRHVKAYNDQGVPTWEGFVNKVTLDTGIAKVVNELDHMSNRLWVRYNSGGSVARSTILNDTDSQGRFGIKERVLIGGDMSLAIADQYAQQVLDLVSWPSPGLREINLAGFVGRPVLQLECLGYWWTLLWRIYTQTAVSGEKDASDLVNDIITADGEFVASSVIDTNSSQVEQEFDTDRRPAEIIKSITDVGDGAFHKWVAGFRDERAFYYKQAARPER